MNDAAIFAALRAIRQLQDSKRSLLPIGYFANVIELTPGLGLAVSTDGVGTKTLLAHALRKYDTIGIDCVAMNVNDILCVGAKPIAMLDYIGIEKATPQILEALAKGLTEGARRANISIPGGETSLMPEVISGVDLVGTGLGLVNPDEVISGQNVQPGDYIIGLRSSGIHSNGLTLARKILGDGEQDHILLEPTRIYVQEVMDLLEDQVPIHALVNITGGGFLNLNRVYSPVSFKLNTLPPPHPIFDLIQQKGNLSLQTMYTTFNMGIGFCIIVPNDHGIVKEVLSRAPNSYVIGRVVEGEQGAIWVNGREINAQA